MPLDFSLSGANRHDSVMMALTLEAIPPPAKWTAQAARQAARRQGLRCQECLARLIVPRIARKGIESSERFGRHRLVVERKHARFSRFRLLLIRYERRSDI